MGKTVRRKTGKQRNTENDNNKWAYVCAYRYKRIYTGRWITSFLGHQVKEYEVKFVRNVVEDIDQRHQEDIAWRKKYNEKQKRDGVLTSNNVLKAYTNPLMRSLYKQQLAQLKKSGYDEDFDFNIDFKRVGLWWYYD